MESIEQIPRTRQDLNGHREAVRQEKPGPGRRARWLQRHPKLAPYYEAAMQMLQPRGLGQRPSWKAIRKTMATLAVSPRIRPPGFDHSMPYQYLQGISERGSWRSWPRVAINANLAVSDV